MGTSQKGTYSIDRRFPGRQQTPINQLCPASQCQRGSVPYHSEILKNILYTRLIVYSAHELIMQYSNVIYVLYKM